MPAMTVTNPDLVTIVSGLPRSGTSMMMRMLEAAGIPALVDNIRAADEDNPRGYYEFEPVKKTKEDPSWLKQAGGKVVKMVYRLLYDLPPDRTYYVVFMQRHLHEVIKSQDVMLSRRGREGGDLPKEKLIELFKKQLSEFEAWVARQPNFRILYVNYNEMLKDPQPPVKAINEFLGGRLDTTAMCKVVEPGLYRQRAES
ncbi:MAG TPA: sulfotransferase domain-containing protein [Phycisphaerae bacterium]|nr:sulfotransferase domain-containing protein [Phycisphaerae bacterium]